MRGEINAVFLFSLLFKMAGVWPCGLSKELVAREFLGVAWCRLARNVSYLLSGMSDMIKTTGAEKPCRDNCRGYAFLTSGIFITSSLSHTNTHTHTHTHTRACMHAHLEATMPSELWKVIGNILQSMYHKIYTAPVKRASAARQDQIVFVYYYTLVTLSTDRSLALSLENAIDLCEKWLPLAS